VEHAHGFSLFAREPIILRREGAVVSVRQWLVTAWLAGSGAVTEGPAFLLDYLLRALRVAVLLSLWRIVLGGAADAPVAIGAVLAYALLAEVLADQLHVRTTLADAFWQGTISQHFLRPMPLVPQFASEMLGGWLVNLALFSLPLVLAAPLFGVDLSPASATAAFALSLALAIVLGLAFDFITAAVTVALEQPVWLVFWVRQAIAVVLSGAVVPLALLPWGLGGWLEWLPFASLAWAPLAIYTGMGEAPRLIALQVFWCLALWPLAGWMWRANREKVVGFGG
jgi:ABC-2 type transport system permease protein